MVLACCRLYDQAVLVPWRSRHHAAFKRPETVAQRQRVIPKEELNVPLSDSSHLTRRLHQSLILHVTVRVLHRFLAISNFIEHKRRYLPPVAVRDSIAVIANVCGLECTGIESRWMRDFLYPSRPALRPTQPPVQCVPDIFLGGGDKASRDWRWPPTTIQNRG